MIYVQDPDFTLHLGDAREVLAGLPDASVDCCVTSPPYFRQRDYGSDAQIGVETTPEAYVAELRAVFSQVRRVLKPSGNFWLNIGDSYAGHNGPGWRPGNEQKNGGVSNKNGTGAVAGYKPKDLIGVPWMLAFALRDDGWWLRSENIWWKTNALPESVEDRPHRAHEHVFQFTKALRYSYAADAVKEPAAWERWGGQTPRKTQDGNARGAQFVKDRTRQEVLEIAGERNLRSVWAIPTQPFADAHFAVMAERLAETCILAGCPEGSTVLDPFLGSGTTALVARRLGRKCVGIELNEEYARLAARRLQQLSLLAEGAA